MDGHRLETRPWWYESGIPVGLANFTKAKYNWEDTYCMFRSSSSNGIFFPPKVRCLTTEAEDYQHLSITDWWFGTWMLFFHSVGNVIIPTDELHHFSEGKVYHQPVKIWPFQEVSLKWWYPLKQSISSRWLVHFGGAPFMAPTIKTDPLVN